MARSVRGVAIASSPAVIERTRLVRNGGEAASVVANDVGSGQSFVQPDLARVIATQYRWMIAYSRRLTNNGPEAADLVHIVIARVLSQRTPIADVANLSGWLRTVLFNTFVDLRRHAQWEIPTDSAALDRPAPPAEEDALGPQLTMDDLRALLAALPARYRVPYEMFSFDDMPYARIAAVLGLSCATVGTRISRARDRLRRLIRARFGGRP